jgi:hypothetical protein
MTRFVGLDVSQKITAICVVDDLGRRLWRGQCPTNPEQISILVRRHVGDDARIGIETGAMTPCARALLGARTQLIGMTTRLSNHIRGALKTFGLLPGAMRGLPFDRKVEALILDRSEVALIVRPMLVAWRQLREQIAVFDKAIRVLVRSNSPCRLLMSVPGIGVLSALAYVSTVEDPGRFSRSRSVGAHLGLSPRQYQSGEVDRSGRISKCGDTLARTLLYEAAVVILTRLGGTPSPGDRAMAKRGWRWPENSLVSCTVSGVRDSRSAGRSTQAPPDFIVREIHPSRNRGCDGCPPGEGTGGCEGGP